MSDTRGRPIVHGAECIFHSCILHTSYFILHIACLALQTSVTYMIIYVIKGRPCNTPNRKTSCRNKSIFHCKELRQKKHFDENKNSCKRGWPDPRSPRSRTARGLPQAEAFEVRLGTLQLGAPCQGHQQTTKHGRYWQNARHQLVSL